MQILSTAQVLCCISMVCSLKPLFSLWSCSNIALSLIRSSLAIAPLSSSIKSADLVPSIKLSGCAGNLIGAWLGTSFTSWRGMTTSHKCFNSSKAVYWCLFFDHGWWASYHPSPRYLINICYFAHSILSIFDVSFSNSSNAWWTVFQQCGEKYFWYK